MTNLPFTLKQVHLIAYALHCLTLSMHAASIILN